MSFNLKALQVLLMLCFNLAIAILKTFVQYITALVQRRWQRWQRWHSWQRWPRWQRLKLYLIIVILHAWIAVPFLELRQAPEPFIPLFHGEYP